RRAGHHEKARRVSGAGGGGGAGARASPDRLLAARAGRALSPVLQGPSRDPAGPRAHVRAARALHRGGRRPEIRARPARGERARGHDPRARDRGMAPPRRVSRTRARWSSRLASLLFGIGCLVVLGVTFWLGVAAGRRWPHGLPGFTASADGTAGTSKERDRKSEGEGLAKTIAEAPPVLTFYRELTAP